MRAWTLPQLVALNNFRTPPRMAMAEICHIFHMHTRDEVVEALDAILRTDSLPEALERVNRVLKLQAEGIPLINGREAWKVTQDRGRKSYAPMF